jgi:hypothetical protein
MLGETAFALVLTGPVLSGANGGQRVDGDSQWNPRTIRAPLGEKL